MEGREALSSYIWRFRSELICVCQNRKRPRVVTQFLSCWNGCERSRSAPQNLISHKIFFLLAFFFSSFFFHKRSPRYKCLIIVLLRVIWLCVNIKVFDPWAWVFFFLQRIVSRLHPVSHPAEVPLSKNPADLSLQGIQLKWNLYWLRPSSRESCSPENNVEDWAERGLEVQMETTAVQRLYQRLEAVSFSQPPEDERKSSK